MVIFYNQTLYRPTAIKIVINLWKSIYKKIKLHKIFFEVRNYVSKLSVNKIKSSPGSDEVDEKFPRESDMMTLLPCN